MNFLALWDRIKAAALVMIGRATYSWFKGQSAISDADLNLILQGFQAALDEDIAASNGGV